jgi:hypothetical protein
MIGLEVGLGTHQQQGTYDASCGCTFESGTGTGFLGSLVFELPLDYEWAVGLKGGIDFKNTSGTKHVIDTAIIVDQTNDEIDTLTPWDLNRIGNVKTTYVNFTPFVQYQFFRMGPFVQTGLGVGILVANHFEHHRELLSTDATLASGRQLHNIRFNSSGTREETVEDAEITDVSKLRLGVQLAAGYNIAVSERSILTPMLTYDFPLTTIRDQKAADWKIGSLYASAVLKFKLD